VRGGEPEPRAPAGRRVEPEFAAHLRDQMAADGQTQPGAAEAPAGRHIGLLEGLEDVRLRLGAHADAAVLDLEAQR